MIREAKSAAEIAAFMNRALRIVPGLPALEVEVRLRAPDATGRNWAAHHPALPTSCPRESASILRGIVRTARRQFNRWDVH